MPTNLIERLASLEQQQRTEYHRQWATFCEKVEHAWQKYPIDADRNLSDEALQQIASIKKNFAVLDQWIKALADWDDELMPPTMPDDVKAEANAFLFALDTVKAPEHQASVEMMRRSMLFWLEVFK
jgi:hypothetical protein